MMEHDSVDKLLEKANQRKKQILDDLRKNLNVDERSRNLLAISCLCRDYTAMVDFQEVAEELLEEDINDDNDKFRDKFRYGGDCPLAQDFFINDKKCSKEDDDCSGNPLDTPDTKKIKVNVVKDNDKEVDVKIHGIKNGKRFDISNLTNEQRETIVSLIDKENYDTLTLYLDNLLDKHIASLQEALPNLGNDLKTSKKELERKKDRSEKEDKRLSALEELFDKVRKSFSDD